MDAATQDVDQELTGSPRHPAAIRRTGGGLSGGSTFDHGAADHAAGHAFGWPLLAAIGLGGFAVLTWLVATSVVIPFDQPLLDAASGLGAYMPAWQGLSDSANYPLIAIGIGIVAWLVLRRQRMEAVLVIGVLAAATAGSEAVKQLTARPRPPGFDDSIIGVVYSYPSGHVLEAVTIYGIISILVWRSGLPKPIRMAVPLIFAGLVILVSVARVAVGAHYPSDVLAGLLGGIGVVALFAWLTNLLASRRTAR